MQAAYKVAGPREHGGVYVFSEKSDVVNKRSLTHLHVYTSCLCSLSGPMEYTCWFRSRLAMHPIASWH